VLAGADLEGDAPSYLTFLLRNDGSYRVAHHAGDEIHEIVGWTASASIMTWTESSEGTARNVLGVDVTEESVTFWVNEDQVSSLPRSELPMAGIVGVRAGDGVSLHITDIVIGPNRQ
jgi:hypothetical protein